MGRKLIDLTGQQFGLLTVVDRAPNTTGDARWNCHCSCGNGTVSWGANLRSGNTTSCGCVKTSENPKRWLRLEGQRFGRLVAITIAPKTRRGNRDWVCRCDCGTEKIISSSNLAQGLTVSCGCVANAGPFVVARSDAVRERAAAVKKRRQQRAAFIDSDVTAEKIRELFFRQKGRCALCRTPITMAAMHRDHIRPVSLGGLHRMANLQLLCAPCNRRKHAKDPLVFAREEGRLL